MRKIILAIEYALRIVKPSTETNMNRNEISRTASDIQANAKLQAELASIAGSAQKETAWATIEGRAQRLANDACECQWTLKMLRRRLAELRGEVVA